jgi:hypothetical protein
MTPVAQPTFVPVADADRVRASYAPPIPLKVRANRPGELRSPTLPTGKGVGTTGPDQGYALTLAHRLAPSLQLEEREDRHDVSLGIALLASRRASIAGRAPCSYDVQVGAGLFGFFGTAPKDLVDYRRALFAGLAHSYDVQRSLVDSVPDAALRLTPDDARDPMQWRVRLGA